MAEVIVNARDGRVFQCCQQVRLALEIAHNCAAHQGVARLVDHFFYSDQLDHVGKVHIPGAINSAHASHANDALNQVAVLESDARLKLLVQQLAGFVIQVLGDLVCFQRIFSLCLVVL